MERFEHSRAESAAPIALICSVFIIEKKNNLKCLKHIQYNEAHQQFATTRIESRIMARLERRVENMAAKWTFPNKPIGTREANRKKQSRACRNSPGGVARFFEWVYFSFLRTRLHSNNRLCTYAGHTISDDSWTYSEYFLFLRKKKDFVGLLCFVFSCVSPSAPSTEFAATENCMCLREKSWRECVLFNF